MDKLDRESMKRKVRLPISNMDTTINELRFKKKDDGTVLRKFNELRADEEQGVVERHVTEALEDCRRRPITKSRQIAGPCKVCGKTVRTDDEVKCAGRCGGSMSNSCYQRQGGHVLHGMKFCRWDYWMTKLFWQWFSPSLRRRLRSYKEERSSEKPILQKPDTEESKGVTEHEKPRGIFE